MSEQVSSFGRVVLICGGIIRLALALTLAFVATVLLAVGGQWLWNAKDREQAKQAEVARHWSKDLTNYLNMRATAKTKLLEGTMHVLLNFEGHPDFLLRPENQQRGFTIRWEDADGFPRVEHTAKLADFSTVLDKDGKAAGLATQFTRSASATDYKELAQMTVQWTVDAKPLKSEPAFGQSDVSVDASAPDHCSPGLTKQERIRRLARLGRVRETGLGEFTVGAHSLSFLPYGSELLLCR